MTRSGWSRRAVVAVALAVALAGAVGSQDAGGQAGGRAGERPFDFLSALPPGNSWWRPWSRCALLASVGRGRSGQPRCGTAPGGLMALRTDYLRAHTIESMTNFRIEGDDGGRSREVGSGDTGDGHDVDIRHPVMFRWCTHVCRHPQCRDRQRKCLGMLGTPSFSKQQETLLLDHSIEMP